jgi:hypothetical protein
MTNTDTMTTAYLSVIDEDALSKHIELKRAGVWDGPMPEVDTTPSVMAGGRDGCSIVQAKGTTAAYAVLEGLQNKQAVDDGDVIPGTECLPVAAFAPRMYQATITKVAEVLKGYDRIVARNFLHGRPGKPLSNVGDFAVQCYDNQSWVAPGSISEEWFVWEVIKEEPLSEEPEKPRRKSTRKKAE